MQALQMSKYTAPPDAGGSWCKSQSVHIWLQVLWISSPIATGFHPLYYHRSLLHFLKQCCHCSQAGGTHIKRWSSRMVFRARHDKIWRFLSNHGADLYMHTHRCKHGGNCPRFRISMAHLELLHTTACCSLISRTRYSPQFKNRVVPEHPDQRDHL